MRSPWLYLIFKVFVTRTILHTEYIHVHGSRYYKPEKITSTKDGSHFVRARKRRMGDNRSSCFRRWPKGLKPYLATLFQSANRTQGVEVVMVFMSDEERFRAELECRGIVGNHGHLPRHGREKTSDPDCQKGFVKVYEYFTLAEEQTADISPSGDIVRVHAKTETKDSQDTTESFGRFVLVMETFKESDRLDVFMQQTDIAGTDERKVRVIMHAAAECLQRVADNGWSHGALAPENLVWSSAPRRHDEETLAGRELLLFNFEHSVRHGSSLEEANISCQTGSAPPEQLRIELARKTSMDRASLSVERLGLEHDDEAVQRPIDECVVPIDSNFVVDQAQAMWTDLVKRTPRLESFGEHVLIMPRGLRDLMDVLAHDRIAGHNKQKVQRYGRETAICLFAMEARGYLHGDVKLLNLMIFHSKEKNAEVLKLIDLDAAVEYDEPAGLKLSSACVPPEVARLIVRYTTDGADPSRDWPAWETWMTAQPDKVLASATFDIWSFGTVLYRLCVEDGVELFLSTQADNIVDREDLRQLAFEWDRTKLDKLSRINLEWSEAHDLILWCLEADASRRPQSFAEVLQHPFLGGSAGVHYQGSVDERARDIHRAVEEEDVDKATAVLQRGGIHADILISSATTVVTPLHRAARKGNTEILDVLIKDGGDVNIRSMFGYSCLHWAVAYGRTSTIQHLLKLKNDHGTLLCDTSQKNDRGKTPWDLADSLGDEEIPSAFDDAATGGHAALNDERTRRMRRPAVSDTFRDDIELDSERFNFWSVDEEFTNWEYKAEGGFGTIFHAKEVSPPIQVSDGELTRRFGSVAVKVPKDREDARKDIVKEVETLSVLTHINVVQILGMFHGKTKGSERTDWKMAQEFCGDDLIPTDLQKMLYATGSSVHQQWTVNLMCDFAGQIVAGLEYIHDKDFRHLDMKPENVFLSKTEDSKWLCKIGDFGMGMKFADDKAADDKKAGLSAAMAPDQTATEADTPVPDSTQRGTSAVAGRAKNRVYGTWEYMPLECWRREYGEPDRQSDVFSVGMMLWEMLSRSRIVSHVLDDDKGHHKHLEKGIWVLDAELVPMAFAKGGRPRYTGLKKRDEYAWHVYYRLMQACWVRPMDARPTFKQTAEVFKLVVKTTDKDRSAAEVQAIVAETKAAQNCNVVVEKKTMSYDGFLAQLDLQDKKEALADYLTEEGAELRDLEQMSLEDLNADILDDDDLGLDEETKERFRAAVSKLKAGGAGNEQTPFELEFGAKATAAAAAEAEKREKNPWLALLRLLGTDDPGLQLPGAADMHEK